ncbi:hypothetical protein BDZ97DRAFT_1891374 [Flammula alnicola]|nr:hypothetical protein BDZ97DRAFT_1891374 [Flammula alnicola]
MLLSTKVVLHLSISTIPCAETLTGCQQTYPDISANPPSKILRIIKPPLLFYGTSIINTSGSNNGENGWGHVQAALMMDVDDAERRRRADRQHIMHRGNADGRGKSL